MKSGQLLLALCLLTGCDHLKTLVGMDAEQDDPPVRFVAPESGRTDILYAAVQFLTPEDIDSATVSRNGEPYWKFYFGPVVDFPLQPGNNRISVRAHRGNTHFEAELRIRSEVPFAPYRLKVLRDASQGESLAADVNGLGVVAATGAVDGEPRAFAWKNGTAVELPGAGSRALRINEGGAILGTRNTDQCSDRGTLWLDGAVIDELPCGARPLDLNDSNDILFRDHRNSDRTVWVRSEGAEDSIQIADPRQSQHLRWITSRFNNALQAAGVIDWIGPGWGARADGGKQAAIVCTTCDVLDINHEGVVLWSAIRSSRNPVARGFGLHGAAEQPGVFADGDAPQAALNDEGEVAGLDRGFPFVWRNGRFHLIQLDEQGWEIVSITAISNSGQITGQARKSPQNVPVAVLLTPAS